MSAFLAQKVAERYFELINAHAFDQVGSLFADDAIVLDPTGEVVRGKAAISARWGEDFARSGPERVALASIVSNDTVCAVEVSPHFAGEDAPRSDMVIDHFSVNEEGKITRLAVYLRPPDPDVS